MNWKKYTLIKVVCTFIFLNFGHLDAQNTNQYCGFASFQNNLSIKEMRAQNTFEKKYQQDFSKKKNRKRNSAPPYLLPVVFHIIHQNGTENIPDEQVLQNLQDLNDAFANKGYYDPTTGADMQIQFCLAKQTPLREPTSGINRINSYLTKMIIETQDLDLKNLIQWNPRDYINIWIVKKMCSTSVGCDVVGYARFPTSHGMPEDGIVVEAGYTGTSHINSSVLVHEMGHYLGLFHTFQGQCKNDDCLTDGDRVCDTPPDQSIARVECGNSVNSCDTDVNPSDSNNPFTTDQNDMYINYMDYGDPSCYSMFTIGQRERMHFTIENERVSLLNSIACNIPCPTTIIADFNVNNTTVNARSTINFINTSTGATEYEWKIDGVIFSEQTNASYNFTTEGSYVITLTAKKDDIYCIDTFEVTIRVQCPVEVSFQSSSTNISPGDIVHFNNISENANQFQWLLDGVVVSTDFNFNKTFSTLGNYDVQLVASDGICFDTSALTIITVSNSGLAQTGLPVWAVTLRSSKIIQSIDWQNPIPNFNTINENGTTLGQTGVAINGCGQIVFYAIQTGSSESNHLNIYAPDGTELLANPGLNAVRGGQELQVIKVPNHNNEWFIIYSEWSTDIGQPLNFAGYNPQRLLYSRVRLNSEYNLQVLERDVVLKADNSQHKYTIGRAVSRTAFENNHQHFLYACRRVKNVNKISLDRWLITENGISFLDNSGDIFSSWGTFTTANSPIELSPIEDKIVVTCRNSKSNLPDFIIFDTQDFTANSASVIKGGDLILVADGTSNDHSSILPSSASIKNIAQNNNLDLQFLTNFEKRLGSLEFSPNGRFLYVLNGGYARDPSKYSYLTYLAQIDLESNPMKVRMQIQTAEDYNPSTGLGCKLTNCKGIWTPISKIQSSFDGNLYFTKTNDSLLYVIPNPNDILPQNLVPSNIDLSTPEEPNILTQGDIIYMPDQIDGYNYLSTQYQEVEIIVDGEFCDHLCPEYNLEIIYDGNILKTFQINSCPDTILFCADTNLVYSLGSAEFNIQYDSAIVLGETNYQPMAPFDFSDFSDCTEICGNEIDDDNDGLIDCDDPDIQDSCCCYIPPILNLGPDSTICDNGTIVLDAGLGFQSYRWWDFSTEQYATAFGSGIYWVEVTDSCGQIQKDTISITIAEETKLNIGKDTTICQGGSIHLSSNGFTEFEWTPPTTLSCTDCETVIATPDTTTQYILLAKNSSNCYSVDTINVAIKRSPSLTLPDDREILLGDTVHIISNSDGQLIEYNWSPNDSIDCTDCKKIIVQPTETTTYSLTIIDENGCTATEMLTIFVKSIYDIYIPNAFTPNGDGTNDIFYILADEGVKQILSMNIYDRWGELVFTNGNFLPNDISNGWDGTFDNKPMNNAVFGYVIEVELLNGRHEIFKGDLTLLR